MSELFLLIDEAPGILAGDSPVANRLRSQVDRIARTPRTTVLLLGARGLELELVARCIHLRSSGKGAFLPTTARRLSASPAQVDPLGSAGGLCERARGGTLFLDEVSELSANLQSDLLRRLEERMHPADAKPSAEALEPRIVASTAEDLETLVQAGNFRPDLFYRLNVLTIRVPSLAERCEDIELLAKGILDRQINQTGRVRSLSPDAIAHLKARPWPGGLFELQAVLAQALLLSQGALIEAAQLAGEQAEGQQTALVPAQARTRSIRASEEALIRRVLVEEEGNRSSTARALGINRTTLYNKLRQYDIS